MKRFILGVLYLDLLIISLILGYKIVLTKDFEIIWWLVISFLALLAMFSWICLRAYERGKKTSVVNVWTVLISIGLTYVVADLITGYLFIKPLSPASVPDQVVHHRMVPSIRSKLQRAEFQTLISTNRFGMRGRDLAQQKAPGTYRILMLGDSFTMGKGVEDNETFSVLLEHRLNKRGRRVEVLNGGVVSYSPALSYLALRENLAKLDPDLVVLNFDMSDLVQEEAYRRIAVYNDDGDILRVSASSGEWSKASERIWLGGIIKNWVDSHLYFGRLAIFYLEKLTSDRLELTIRNVVKLANLELLAHTLKTDTMDRSDQWKNIFDSIVRIKSFCDDRGIRFFMTIYPWGHQINDKEWVPGRYYFLPKEAVISDKSLRVIDVLSKENGIDLLNLFPAFRARQAEGPLYYNYDMHWRPKGHEIMAEELENYIQEISLEML